MDRKPRKWRRRSFLKHVGAGVAAGGLLGLRSAEAKDATVEVSDEHLRAVNRRRRITVQYDGYNALGKDWDRWLAYRFSWLDAPGVQIDSVWWDIQPLLKHHYPTPPGSLIYEWPDKETDIVARLVEETRKRDLEIFWNHRISEVDLKPPNTGGGWTDTPHPLKQSHPDWVMHTWWPHGLWNLANVDVRRHKVGVLRHLAETYPLDGFQLDFARHVPCLPVGRQWELRHHVTEFVRLVREMTLEVAGKRGRPILLAARVPRSLKGCRIDGFDVERWAQQHLVDVFSLGSRSTEVDVEAFRQITAGRPIKLQPCLDDHHAPDGYRCPPIEVFRGTFANWWQQGADSVMTFNWASAAPQWCEEMGGEVAPLSELAAYREVGSPTTLRGKDKTFVVERRGGYPWADGYFNRNEDAPLPATFAAGGEPTTLTVRIADPIRAEAGKLREVLLELVFFAASDEDQFDVRLNGTQLEVVDRDPDWKDPQIFSPKPEPASGGRVSRYRVNPRQKLLRLQYSVAPQCCLVGKNRVRIRRLAASTSETPARVDLEKLEVHVRYG
jgi:hypothetical protein